MKKLLNLAFSGIGLALVASLLINCGGKTGKDTKPETPPVVYSGTTGIGITHSVNNYADWLKVYLAKTDSNSRISIYTSPDDPNRVTVFMLSTSHADAKAMAASDQLKNDMKEAGVSSEPVITFFDIKYRAPGKSAKKYRISVNHEVADYDAWKKVFDADEPRRTEANLELRAISTDADNPKKVGIMFATEDPEKVKAMMSSDDLNAKMKEGGVVSEPVVVVLVLPPSN